MCCIKCEFSRIYCTVLDRILNGYIGTDDIENKRKKKKKRKVKAFRSIHHRSIVFKHYKHGTTKIA